MPLPPLEVNLDFDFSFVLNCRRLKSLRSLVNGYEKIFPFVCTVSAFNFDF